MSLRDQLLKAGLVDKKKAKKAEKASKKKKYQENRSGQVDEEDLSVKKSIEEEKLKRQAQDKKLNEELENQRKEREKLFRAYEIIYSKNRLSYDGDVPYYFKKNDKEIGRVRVTEQQLLSLTHGKMGIAVTPYERDGVSLLDLEDCEKLRDLAGNLLTCLHSKPDSSYTLEQCLIGEVDD